MLDQDKPAVELAFDELAAVVAEKERLGISFTEFLKRLEAEVEAATRKYELARTAADICQATKLRKPRSDRGRPRKKPDPLPATPADPAT